MLTPATPPPPPPPPLPLYAGDFPRFVVRRQLPKLVHLQATAPYEEVRLPSDARAGEAGSLVVRRRSGSGSRPSKPVVELLAPRELTEEELVTLQQNYPETIAVRWKRALEHVRGLPKKMQSGLRAAFVRQVSRAIAPPFAPPPLANDPQPSHPIVPSFSSHPIVPSPPPSPLPLLLFPAATPSWSRRQVGGKPLELAVHTDGEEHKGPVYVRAIPPGSIVHSIAEKYSVRQGDGGRRATRPLTCTHPRQSFSTAADGERCSS